MPNTTENLENVTPAMDHDVETPVTPSTDRRRTRQRQTVRTLEELHNLPVRKMNETELVKYVDSLRDLVVQQDGTINELKKTCESAFERNRQMEQKYSEFRMKANAKFQYLRSGIQNLQLGVGLLGSLED